jgi:hypothetical protein
MSSRIAAENTIKKKQLSKIKDYFWLLCEGV